MSWVKPAFLAAALSLAGVGHAAQAGVIVSASGPSSAQYKVGTKLADNARVTLRQGDTITVLTNGQTRVLRGAGTFNLGRNTATTRRSAFASLTRQRSAQRVRTGAVRGPEDEQVSSPNLWYVDVARPGTVCLPDAGNVRLYRSVTTIAMAYQVSPAGGGASHTIRFAEGETVAPWDNDNLTVTPGGQYRIASDNGATDSEFTLVMLAEPAADAEGLAEQLIQNGCTTQLELLTSALMVAE